MVVNALTRKVYIVFILMSIFGMMVHHPLLTEVTSQEYKTGCEQGQFVKYKVNANYSGFYKYSQWEWTKFTVKNVSTSKVWLFQKVHYENSTESRISFSDTDLSEIGGP